MKKVIDIKTNKKQVVFNEYKIGQAGTCPECGRTLKDYDIKRLNANGYTRCVKCGAKLTK